MGYTSGDWRTIPNQGGANQGGTDGFISKFDVSGNRSWTRLIGTTGNDAARGVAVDSSNNVYVVGELNFVEGATGTAYLRKYDSSGGIMQETSISAAQLATARGVALDSSGNICVTGYAIGDMNYGNFASNPGGESPFLIKYNPSGSPLWTRFRGDLGHDYGYGVATDSGDNIYVVGKTEGSFDLQTNLGETDAFIIKFSSSGGHVWTKFLGGTGADGAYAVAVEIDPAAYLCGR